jgi:streptogramin lyase
MTASISTRSPRIASRRSTRGADACSPRSRRRAAAATPGLAWAEGTLWVGQYRERKIHQVDPETGKVLRTIQSNRFVTGVTWVDGELWHGTLEDDASDLRRIDPRNGEVQERIEMPRGVTVSGLESDGSDRFFCGGGTGGKVRAVRRPRRAGR